MADLFTRKVIPFGGGGDSDDSSDSDGERARNSKIDFLSDRTKNGKKRRQENPGKQKKKKATVVDTVVLAGNEDDDEDEEEIKRREEERIQQQIKAFERLSQSSQSQAASSQKDPPTTISLLDADTEDEEDANALQQLKELRNKALSMKNKLKTSSTSSSVAVAATTSSSAGAGGEAMAGFIIPTVKTAEERRKEAQQRIAAIQNSSKFTKKITGAVDFGEPDHSNGDEDDEPDEDMITIKTRVNGQDERRWRVARSSRFEKVNQTTSSNPLLYPTLHPFLPLLLTAHCAYPRLCLSV